MKTLSVRPVFVKIDTKDSLISDRNILTFSDGKIYKPFKNQYYQLILISLDSDEKIEVGDKFINDYGEIVTATKSILDQLYFSKKKVIAIQDQLYPDLINQLVAEHNNGGMRDFEIEQDGDYDEHYEGYYAETVKPKVTNGFVTVVEKHIFGVLNDPKINGVDYENTPVPDYPIGKPLDDYINAKHSQDRCMGFIDGYNARKLEEPISYTEEEVYKLFKKSCERLTNSFISSDIEWFNENKKK